MSNNANAIIRKRWRTASAGMGGGMRMTLHRDGRTCPLGDDCDLTVAWMAGSADGYSKAAARIAALEAEVMEQARLNGMGGEREANLLGRIARLELERDAARAEAERLRALQARSERRD